MPLEITFLGHSGFVLSDGGAAVAIDPFLTGNPVAKHKPADLKVGYIALTHGHSDHFGDTLAIAKANRAVVYCVWEIHEYLHEHGHTLTQPANIGGRIDTEFGFVAFTQAFHSSSLNGRYMGLAAGLVINIGGVTVYHCGDTALFNHMKDIGDYYKPDIAMIPVGDRFTMGPAHATRAAELIRPKVAIPIHYRTFPGMLLENISAFKPACQVRIMEPGESWNYEKA